jgi:HSP20 family protein
MPIVRFDRSPRFGPIHGEMSRLFSTFFDTPTTRGANGGAMHHWIPAMDLVQGDEHIVLKADLPGMTEADVNIEVDDNVLRISGKRQTEVEDKHEGYYRRERTTGAFSRALALPEGIDPAAVTATFSNGVLDVRIPKPIQATPHRVPIAAGADSQTTDSNADETITE